MIFRSKYSYVSGALYGVVFFGIAIVAMFGGITCTAVAGDLLRGGYTSAQSGSTTPGTFTPPSVAKARRNANDVLARTTQAIQAVMSMQSAARKLAQTGNNAGANPNNPGTALPNVPNGLGVGGLYPAGGVAQLPSGWTGVKSLTESQSGKETIVMVTQNSPDAVLTWTNFNVGAQTTLDFNQKAGGANVGKWIAFNFVNDPSGVPSQILGSIEAPGQVYIINQNGIVFGGSSQVNLHTLVASSLPMNTFLISNGLLNNPDDQFLFSALTQPAGTNGSPEFDPPAALTASGADGDVIVEAGAQITAPASQANVGGRVALIGPNVTNDGTISTPDGQTILAAGLQVGLTAHPSSDPTLRGLDVYVGAVSSSSYPSKATAGDVTNNGDIEVPEGDATMVGEDVNQMGVIASTTSVTLNGRIDLLADYNSASSGGVAQATSPFEARSSGALTFGADSVTEILPELDSAETVVGTALALSSVVNLQGKTIHMDSDSTLLAPDATITANAGVWDYRVQGGDPTDKFTNTGGQIYLDPDAIIDAAGSVDVQASVDQNIVAAQLLGPELADSPSQRNGVFVGQTIDVDIRDTGVYDGVSWVGTPLADVSGYAGLIEYTVGELTVNGGTVNLNAGGSVVMQAGSQVNVSGGWIDYQGGVVSTSEVISGGHVYPISEATPDLVYQGFNLGTFTVDHPTYGISATYTDPILDVSHYEDSYISGGNGGTIAIASPSVALDGALIGTTSPGPRQRSILSTENSLASSSLPSPSTLSLAFEEEQVNGASTYEASPATPPNIVFSDSDGLPAAAFAVDSSGNPAALSVARQDEVIISPDLFTSGGFGSLKIYDGDGNVTVPAGISLDPGPDGSITISAANVDIAGSITAPGGSLSFTVYDFSPYQQSSAPITTPPVNPARGHFILGSGASLSTAGLVVDDRDGSPDADTLPLVTNGGSVSIDSFNADLAAGSVIDVSGGVEMTTSGKPAYGNGGSITISAGEDPGISSIIDGALTLGSELEGFSGTAGGSLSIQAQLVQVGGAATHPDTLLISPDFFDQGGFDSFTLTGLGGLTDQSYDFVPAVFIAPGTKIAPVAMSFVAVANTENDSIQLTKTVLPVGVRPPVSLTLDAPGVNNPYNPAAPLLIRGDIVMGAGSSIQTDPSASANVTFNGNTVAVLGSVTVPGGSIIIKGGQNSSLLFAAGAPVPTVDLGPNSVLSTAGITVLVPNAYGHLTGSVLNGGTINVSGNIVAEAGAVLNVSGASGVLDVTPVQADAGATPGGAEAVQNGSFQGMVLVPEDVDSNGGAIILKGSQELFAGATLIGAPGGSAGIGGSLSLSSGLASADVANALDPTLNVTQNGTVIPVGFYPAGGDAIGHLVVNKAGDAITPMGYVAVDSFQGGGFDSVSLLGTVQFSGPVNISTPGSLIVATGGVILANAPVNLTSNYVELGLAFQPPTQPSLVTPLFNQGAAAFYFDPTYGTGDLTVTANLIDIGTLSLQDIGKANFIANGGDIRGDGTLDVAGNILMQSGQVYVPTETSFTIDAYNYTVGTKTDLGSVTFAASGDRDLPLSAGGVLSVYASDITQDGVLRAPQGVINLGWDGSGTAPIDPITNSAVATTATLTLGKGSITSVSAVDPLTGQALIIPYGTNPEGTNWIDPSGADITAGGVPQKAITISAINIKDEAGAVIDIKGGGDLLTAQFVPGIGGNNDILGSASSFAIIPGYQATYAPYDTDAGYNNSRLVPGDQIYLNGSTGLPAGTYTLLPARYALLPGAFLVTPQTGLPAGISAALPDGGSLVSGYRMAPGQTAAPLTTSFEVDSSAVIATLAPYTVYSGNQFFTKGAMLNGQKVPRLPQDSGQLSFQALSSLTLAGMVESTPLQGGLGGLVDISSPENILIQGATGGSAPANTLVLNANELNSFGAASLLIGGTRTTGADGIIVNVQTDDITVDNSGDPLTGSDIILACNDTLTVAPGAEIEGVGDSSGAEDITVAGNGVLLRVGSDPNVTVTRTNVTPASGPELAVGAGAKLSGASVTLDSSGGTNLSTSAIITAQSVALNSGQITIELTNPGAGAPTPTAASGLILSGAALQSLFGSAQSVSLLSYSSIDIYGTGALGATGKSGEAVLKNFTMSAGEIRGFNSSGGEVTIASQNILLENSADATDPGATASTGGTLILDGDTIALGTQTLAVDQFGTVDLNASGGITGNATSGALTVNGDLNVTAPLITGAAGSGETISASGALDLSAPATAGKASVTGGYGASLTLEGASVTANTDITLHTGSLTLHATNGDLTVGDMAAATLDVSGQSKTFFDVTEYTSGGQIDLVADQGNVTVGTNATINASADAGGGNAGTLSISAPEGSASLLGNLLGQGGKGGETGVFSLDVGSIPSVTFNGVTYAQGNLDALDAILDAGSFTHSITIRDRTDADITLNDSVTADAYNVSADTGSITIAGTINASDVATEDASGNPISVGGSISLQAGGSVTLLSGAVLTVAAQDYNNAQQGGSVDLEAGSDINGVASSTAVVDIETGSTIDLSVADANPAQGDLAGTLQIRAPQMAGNTDLQVDAINGTITGASSITVEGYQIFNAASKGGSIDGEEAAVYSNGETFAGNTQAISDRLLANNTGLAGVLIVEPGAEIINPTGNLTLANTWDLSTYRFGPDSVPGDLTLRASGNVVFNFKASLSDGFDPTQAPDRQEWDAPLLSNIGETSWSYRIVAGADFSGANFLDVLPASRIAAGSGSVLIGQGAPALPTSGGANSKVNQTNFQTIRTGAGSIQISAGGNVELLNNLATVYSAGTQAPALANFIPPDTYFPPSGLDQNPPIFFYPAQYTEYGGDVSLYAQGDIEHLTRNSQGQIVADSSLELPDNWLNRQGYIDPDNGQMDAESTSWWINFSNFYEGVATFGGGNVSMRAGGSIVNVDASVATNAAMPNGVPDASALVELGGGNLSVSAGNDISGGVYYVERGVGGIAAGGQITTNSTRATINQAQANLDASKGVTPDPSTWLPTTLFAGEAILDVSAGGNLELGPVANPFLLPQSLYNSFYNRSFFSTYSSSTELNVQSLTGNIEIKDAANGISGSLIGWLTNMDTQYSQTGTYAAASQPWLSIIEPTATWFSVVAAIMPPVVDVTAFSGSISLVGDVILDPAPDGTLDLVAAGSINGMQPNGYDFNTDHLVWSSGVIDVSDADPASIPNIATPIFGDFNDISDQTPFINLNPLFSETGSITGPAAVLQAQEALHAPGLLHAKDATPIHLYAATGNISGFTLYSPKVTKVVAGEDITDATFYIQNDNTSDVSVVSAGQDIVAYDPTSPLRLEAQEPGNELLGVGASNISTLDTTSKVGDGFPTPGDIQISGPGTLEVLAGRDLTLGVGTENSDGTSAGITSIGNARNPYLPFDGAQVVVAAGLGGIADGLESSTLDFQTFDSTILAGVDGSVYFSDLAATEDFGVASYSDFEKLSKGQQAIVGLDLFYLVLRDAGRNHNLPGNPGYGNYAAATAAIGALLPANAGAGDINLTSKEIKTGSGGDIDILDPAGELTVGIELAGGQPVDQGILTDDGGNISIITQGSVNIGTSRIFTLQGGNIIIWSSEGNIDAGNASKTVQSAPPTRVLVDPESANVETDLSGLATGGGIGVLATVQGVPPGNVDLIAPTGVIDAGNAGIRATGNLNLAAVQILNASNIQVGGASSGVPTVVVSAPNLAGLSAASSAAGATTAASNDQTNATTQEQAEGQTADSVITVSVIGYGGGDSGEDSGG